MTLIGIEEHWASPAITAALLGLPVGTDDSLAFNDMDDNLGRLEDLGAARIAAMDEQGIALQVVSLAPPATGPLAGPDAVALSREANDLAAEAVGRNPTRMRAMATLPMAQAGAVAGELERAASLGHVGAMLYGRTGDVPLDDPRYEDLFATAERLEFPLFIHPQIPSKAVRAAAYSGLGEPADLALATFSWGWHLEAALAALRLIARGTFDRHPRLKIVLGHWGELLLFWQERANSIARIAGLERSVTEVLAENFWFTSSGIFTPALLHHALESSAIGRLLFSTDYPFQRPTRGDIDELLAEFETDADRAAFVEGNARELYGIDGPIG